MGPVSNSAEQAKPLFKNGNHAAASDTKGIAERLLRDAEELRCADPELFLKVVREIAENAGILTPTTTKDFTKTAGIFKDDPDWQHIHSEIVADYDKE